MHLDVEKIVCVHVIKVYIIILMHKRAKLRFSRQV